ncbi:hypothetical protein [Lutimonas vermicola]|uniref:ATP-grasp domain-containing protein n=1 Tax=Lutimonas vermicola TaxID=414288 RepID=A0ABU9L6A6_9FLAO
MRVGIHFEPKYNFSLRHSRYEKILQHNKIDVIRFCSSDPDFMLKLKSFDAIVWYVGLADVSKQPAYDILPVIEKQLKIPCFPSSNIIWSFDNKLKQFFQMKAANFPIIQSWIVYEEKEALRLANEIKLPVVFKLGGGAGSSNVILIKSRKQLLQLTRKMFKRGIAINTFSKTFELSKHLLKIQRYLVTTRMKLFKRKDIRYRYLIKNWSIQRNYLFLQKYMPNNGFDTRVTTIGNRVFAFRRINRPNDFRSSGSGNIDYNSKAIDIRCVKKALEISEYFGFETMSYDFLYDDKNNPVFCEYSYGYNDEAIYKCSGYWDENLNFVNGNYWPQYLHLKDLLNLSILKQPESL